MGLKTHKPFFYRKNSYDLNHKKEPNKAYIFTRKSIKNPMKKLRFFFMFFLAVGLLACGEEKSTTAAENSSTEQSTSQEATTQDAPPDASTYDPKRGEGKFTEIKLEALDANMASSGQKIASVKCTSCHKLTDERLVGPGWKGVTERRKPEWIMNFVTNPDPMISKDPELQTQLEICLVRMPNQNISDQEARDILEFMRQNDGAK